MGSEVSPRPLPRGGASKGTPRVTCDTQDAPQDGPPLLFCSWVPRQHTHQLTVQPLPHWVRADVTRPALLRLESEPALQFK